MWVVAAQREQDREAARTVVVEGLDSEQACPDCGVLSGAVQSRRRRRIKDLPHGRRPLQLWWDQRRTFAGTSGQIGPGHRLTLRLR